VSIAFSSSYITYNACEILVSGDAVVLEADGA
jgi:hypothetical protein